MQDQVAELVRQGRQLPPDDRERLVDGLLESLNLSAVAELEGTWEAEIERRLAAYDSGQVQAIDADLVFAKARRAAEG
jgi:putative addiction module component (TIGR02574 family)